MSKSKGISMANRSTKSADNIGPRMNTGSKPNNLTSTKPYTPINGKFHQTKF